MATHQLGTYEYNYTGNVLNEGNVLSCFTYVGAVIYLILIFLTNIRLCEIFQESCFFVEFSM